MKKYFYLLMVFAITCFVGCKDKNAPSGEGDSGGASTKMSDYVGTWNVEGYQQTGLRDDKLLCVQLNKDTCCLVVDMGDKHAWGFEDVEYKRIYVCSGGKDSWTVSYNKFEGIPYLNMKGYYHANSATYVYSLSYRIASTEPNKITLDIFNSEIQERDNMYFVRTSEDTMRDYVDKYGDKE